VTVPGWPIRVFLLSRSSPQCARTVRSSEPRAKRWYGERLMHQLASTSNLTVAMRQTPASAIAMLQPTFDSTWNADAAERFLRRLGPVGLDSEKSVGGGYNRVRPGVGGPPGRVCGHGWNRGECRKIRRSTHLRRSSLRRYSDGNGFWTTQTLDFDESKPHLTPCYVGTCIKLTALVPIARPTAMQQARNSLPTARARAAMMLDSPLRQPDRGRQARRSSTAKIIRQAAWKERCSSGLATAQQTGRQRNR
jgi:hypothetical protein